MKRVVMVIAPEVFRDEEYRVPKGILESRGAEVVTASTRPGECTGKLGMIATAQMGLADARDETWDAVVLVGGGGSEVFFDDPDAHAVAEQAFSSGSVTAAICIAPSTLAHAGLLRGRRATAFPSQESDLVAHGAVWTGEPVSVDGALITASGPEAASRFGEAIADALGLPNSPGQA
jgi:protease I